MTHGRSTAPRSSSPFTFPIQLPVLHPPRLLKRHSTSHSASTPTHSLISPTSDYMAPMRNRKRRDSLTLPDLENCDTAVAQVWPKRKAVPSLSPLSPRVINVELAKDVLRRQPAGEEKRLPASTGDEQYIEFVECTTDVQNPEHMHIEHQLIDPPSLSQICASPRSPPLELTLEEELASLPTQNDSSLISELGTNIPVLLAPDSPDSDFDDFEVQFEEMNVRSARSRAQHRERVARRYESMCNARVRFLKEQAAQALVLAEMSAAATRQPVNNPTFFNVFGASLPGPISVSSSPKPSPVMFQSAPLTRMSSPSPYTVCGETVDLASVPPTDCASGSFDSRSVVDRILASLDHFDLDDISIDGLSETECRRLRTESRRRRRLDRSRVFELGVLLELKRRQIGRSRSSSSSSGSSVSCTSSDSEVEPASPPCTPLAVQTMNHLVAKMVLKRRETAQKQFSTAAASREIFESRGCSSLRVAISPVDTAMPTIQARRRSHSRNRLASDFFSLSRSILGSNDSSWLREKRRLASLDLEQ